MSVTIYPTALKYKDSNGIFQGIECIKGDTYTLNAADKSEIAGLVTLSDYVETVSGTAVTITGVANHRYVCGEITTISITPPQTGTIDVFFTVGTSSAVLTLPSGVKMPDWWTGLETNHAYEIMITDGIYGSVMSWAM